MQDGSKAIIACITVCFMSVCMFGKTKDMEIMVQDEDSTSETVLPDGETPTDLQDTIPEQEQVEVMYSLQMDFPEEPLSPGASNGSDWMYAGDMIEVRAFPLEDAPVTHHASNMVVRVHTVVRYEDSDWALVTTPWADTMYGTMGYVRLCDLVEYTGMEEQIVCYPVKYSETAVDLETGEKLPTCSHPVWGQYMGDEQAEVYWEGGEAHRISRSTVLKPVLEDGEMIFPDPNITEETETVHQYVLPGRRDRFWVCRIGEFCV